MRPSDVISTDGDGNPFLPADKVAQIETLLGQGASIKAISREVGVAYGTAHKYVQKLKEAAL